MIHLFVDNIDAMSEEFGVPVGEGGLAGGSVSSLIRTATGCASLFTAPDSGRRSSALPAKDPVVARSACRSATGTGRAAAGLIGALGAVAQVVLAAPIVCMRGTSERRIAPSSQHQVLLAIEQFADGVKVARMCCCLDYDVDDHRAQVRKGQARLGPP